MGKKLENQNHHFLKCIKKNIDLISKNDIDKSDVNDKNDYDMDIIMTEKILKYLKLFFRLKNVNNKTQKNKSYKNKTNKKK